MDNSIKIADIDNIFGYFGTEKIIDKTIIVAKIAICKKYNKGESIIRMRLKTFYFYFLKLFYSTTWKRQASYTTDCETLLMESQLLCRNACI